MDTHHHPEVLQVLELGEVFLQLWVDGLVLDLRIFQEGPELLQSVQLTWTTGNRTAHGSFQASRLNQFLGHERIIDLLDHSSALSGLIIIIIDNSHFTARSCMVINFSKVQV